MKKTMGALVLLSIAGVLYAQANFLSNIGFGLRSSPEDNGNVTEGELSYRIQPNWTAAIRMKSLTTAETETIPDADKSLNLVRSTNTEFFVYPAEIKIMLGENVPFYIGGGLYLSSQSTREIGFFKLNSLTVPLNSYDNELKATFYGPVVDAGIALDLPYTNIKLDAAIVPIFLFKTSQTEGIDPMLSTIGTNDFSSTGFPYIAVKLRPTFFDFIGPDISYEFQHFSFSSLSPTPLATTPITWAWDKSTDSYGVHTLTLRGNISIPLFNKAKARIGYGRKLTWIIPDGGKAIFENKGTLSMEFSM